MTKEKTQLFDKIGSSNWLHLSWFFFLSLGIFISCKKEEAQIQASEKPTVVTNSPSMVTYNDALCGGSITSDGGKPITAKGVCWSTATNPTIDLDTKTNEGAGKGEFTSKLAGLAENTTYFVRAYATNEMGTSYGTEVNFTTQKSASGGLPEFASMGQEAVSEIKSNSAKVTVTITSDGGSQISSKGLCWSATNPNPIIELDSKTADGSGAGTFTGQLTGLSSFTSYYVRAYAINANGIAYGPIISFSTLGTLPYLVTGNITERTGSTAICSVTVLSDGGLAITQKGICWSTNPNPTIDLNTKTNNGSGNGNFTASLGGLTPYTYYYVRAYASTAAGTGYGMQVRFRTTTPIYVTDVQGNRYSTIVIGTQTWMRENLKTGAYRNGDLIPTSLSNSQWQSTTSGAYAIYENNPGYNEIYGKLYNGYTVTDPRGLCPMGWHVPTDQEWTTLTMFLGGYNAAGGKLKSTDTTEMGNGYWLGSTSGTGNSSGFNAMPGGERTSSGNYYLNLGIEGTFWASTGNSTYADNRKLLYWTNAIQSWAPVRSFGYSVRCIKD